MITVQTIQLNDDERLALQKALGIIDKISDVAEVSMESVFDYFVDVAEIKDDYEYYIESLHNIEEIKGE